MKYLINVKFINQPETTIGVIADNHSGIVDFFYRRNTPLSEAEYFHIYKEDKFMNSTLNNIAWYFKQLLPLSYFSHYGSNGKWYVAHWKMWLGRSYDVKRYEVNAQVDENHEPV